MTLTKHARQRMQERRIAAEQIEMALFYGEKFPSRGVWVYALSERCGAYPTRLPRCLRGLVVVVDEAKRVLTAYRCPRRDLRARFAVA